MIRLITTIQLALRNNNLPECQWETVLNESLHAIRSLLCTATNTTPHDRFLGYQRRSAHGPQIPSWLLQPGPVFLRRFVRNKSDPLVDEVDLLECHQNYATVRYPNGSTDTVSVQYLAPLRQSGPKLNARTSSLEEEIEDINCDPDPDPLNDYENNESPI